MQAVVFYTLLLGFVVGIFLEGFGIDTILVVSLCFITVLVSTVILLRLVPTPRVHTHGAVSLLLGIICFLSATALGFFRAELYTEAMMQSVLSESLGETVTVAGVVIREPDVRETSTLLTVKVEDTRVLVRTNDSIATYGDTITITGRLEAPESFTSELGRTFDYEGYLLARGVLFTISFAEVRVTSEGSGLLSLLYEIKAYFVESLRRVIPAPASELGLGLLLGVQSGLGDTIEDAFRTTGIIHIVVLSGFNIMLVVTFVLFVLSFVTGYKARLIVGGLGVVIFALLVGYSPSVMRASLMALLFLLGTLLARPYHILRMLLLAGAIMLAVNPLLLWYDIGFQLSFMATLGLILVAPVFESWFAKVPSWRVSLKSYLVVTLATQVAGAPLLLYHIGEWSLVAVPVNMMVLPLVPVAMLLTFITGLLALVSLTLAYPLALITTFVLSTIIAIAVTVASLPFAAVGVPPFSPYVIPILYLLIAVLWYVLWYRPQHRGYHGAYLPPIPRALYQWVIEEESVVLARLKEKKHHDTRDAS